MNRLAGEKSPYLLQHAENPVDWYPWGEEAFRKAEAERKPIFLSIGYSTCHWCHVMEHESFEDAEVAAALNGSFVSIKVDREERPDIDHIYMSACQAATGSGGWPLSIFMGPDRKPFFAGTYFPKTPRLGSPGFLDVLRQVASLWAERRADLGKVGEEITRAIGRETRGEGKVLDGGVIERAYRQLDQAFDPAWGGFGGAPKFPTPHNINFLLRYHKRHPDSRAAGMAEKTLQAMRAGGMFDQVGFGFHRYSVDSRWAVPHFEKMLYDQALLALAYTDAFLASGKPVYASVAAEIFEYVTRDMKDPGGAFYSAEDADSEGREGLFYTWTPEEIASILGKDEGELFCRAYGITKAGNFEAGRSIPHVPASFEDLAREIGMDISELTPRLESGRRKVLAAREGRAHPAKDDKVLLAWNGLMIAALARGAQALGDMSHAALARNAADFLLGRMRDSNGRLLRRYRRGEAAGPGFADDYAFLIWGLIELYETVFDVRYLAEAVELQERMAGIFSDEAGGFFFTGEGNEDMIVRNRVVQDGALPSSNSVAALNLLRLGALTGNTRFEEQADRLMRSFAGQVALFPSAYTHFLQAVDFATGPVREIIIAGDASEHVTREMIEAVHGAYLPNRAVLLKEASGSAGLSRIAPMTEGIDGGPAAYVCEGFQCKEPVSDPAALRSMLRE
ncbi:MAG: thioredoxin domain-containing protein [Desulfobacteraceae bacterium]|nr:thioredoxin domain-containing protein [Desulfobacteraceae bacterium]